MKLDEVKETITDMTLIEFEDLVNFVYRQGKERNAGIKKFNENIAWTIEPRHESVH